jgi:hypothetical protein
MTHYSAGKTSFEKSFDNCVMLGRNQLFPSQPIEEKKAA